jgi:hypothetical protein
MSPHARLYTFRSSAAAPRLEVLVLDAPRLEVVEVACHPPLVDIVVDGSSAIIVR